jgi:hypothetical protein
MRLARTCGGRGDEPDAGYSPARKLATSVEKSARIGEAD